MKLRTTLFALLAAVAALSSAQQATTPPASATPAATPPSMSQQALSWVQSQWARVQKDGRPAAERVVREFPARFRDLKAQVSRIADVVGQAADPQRLPEKRELILELWRVRGSLNLVALCSPDVIHQITGLDTAGLAGLQAQVARLSQRLAGH